MNIDKLKVGIVVNNSELMDTFLCGSQGGMRRSIRTNSLILISDHTKVYHDRWHNDVILYTGMGLTGNQDFQFMQNKTLYESQSNGVTIHLFEVLKPKEYTYMGIAELTDTPYTEQQYDQDENPRSVCLFPLRIKSND
ncbi:MAG: HNH endonuclease [Clostridia bacterium]